MNWSMVIFQRIIDQKNDQNTIIFSITVSYIYQHEDKHTTYKRKGNGQRFGQFFFQPIIDQIIFPHEDKYSTYKCKGHCQ